MILTEEEKKALKDLKDQIEQDKSELPYSEESLKNKETILNLINKQNKIIEYLCYTITYDEKISDKDYCFPSMSCQQVGGNQMCEDCLEAYIIGLLKEVGNG